MLKKLFSISKKRQKKMKILNKQKNTTVANAIVLKKDGKKSTVTERDTSVEKDTAVKKDDSVEKEKILLRKRNQET